MNPSFEDCVSWSSSASETARKLRSINDEWSVVCVFYAAYHLMKAALLSDPIFNSNIELAKISPNLTLADQHVTKHRARKGDAGASGLGLNEIVSYLYPDLASRYERLHMASVEVRYNGGLQNYDQQSLLDGFILIKTEFDAGRIKATVK